MEEKFFPEDMKRLPNWVLWRLEDRNNKLTKVPYQTNGRRASPTDPKTWATHGEVLQAYKPEKYKGIGFVFSKSAGIVFIDIDHCIEEDGLDDRARDILDAFMDDEGKLATFVEYSQSGTGLHIYVKGEIPRCFNNRNIHVEMYDSGRFSAMTGNLFCRSELGEFPDGLRYVFEKYKTKAPVKIPDWTSKPVDMATQRNDDWIIEHARDRQGNSNKFPALFSGDWGEYGSQSEADLALCKILAFWTNNDPEAIDRIFRRSGLYRAKWERKDYSRRTIGKAIAENEETLAEFTRRKEKERAEKCYYEWGKFIRKD